jgi:hypothetical protein
MLQTCMCLPTLPPGPCDKVAEGYHSLLENGNPCPSLSIGLLPNAYQQPPFPAKLECPMEGGNYYAEK